MVSQYGETGRLGDEERVGSGKLSLLPPSLGGDPSLEDLLQGEAEPLEEAWRLKWELPLDRGRHTWSRNYDEVKRNPPPKPPHMNEGGIASLLSNGGSEAMMLDLEGEPPFNMQEIMDEELGIRDPRDPFSSLTPELMQEIGEMIFPGAGMVKMGRMGFGLLGKLANKMGRGKPKPKDVGGEELAKIRKELDMPEYSPKGQDPRPSSLGTERSKPPELRYGGALSYKKGYYGKSYK